MKRMTSNLVVREAVSAGGVVYRDDGGALMIALCGRIRPGTWNLPKGTPDYGETIEETALREVQEETGLEVEIERQLGHIEYCFTREKKRFHKTVHFFLMGERGGSFDLHDPEFDVVEWFPAAQAARSLTFETEAEVLRRAIDALASRSSGNA
jgi:8-oxo-dGTP pyrophosphatase MutT (NUDIX family)